MEQKFQEVITPLEDVRDKAREIFNNFIDTTSGREPFPEEYNETEKAIREAGDAYDTPVDENY